MSEEEKKAALPYERIPEQPLVIDEPGEFLSMAEKIQAWISDGIDDASQDEAATTDKDQHPRLKIGVVWGGRGSGKTSMLLTVLALLRDREPRKQEEHAPPQLEAVSQRRSTRKLRLPEYDEDSGTYEAANETWPLFEPSTVIDGERLFFHLLAFLERRYLCDIKSERFKKCYELEAKASDPSRFLDYDRDTASSKTKLKGSIVEFYQELGRRSQLIRKSITEDIGTKERPGRLVLLIDDIDLKPEHAYELLQILHIYFRDVDMAVLLAADREQMLRSIDHSLREQGRGRSQENPRMSFSPGLGAQILAKHVTADWRLPIPNEKQRRFELLERDRSASSGHRPFQLSRWWDGFRVEAQSERVEPAMAKDLFIDAAPTTWRGLIRLHNRALALEEQHGGIEGIERRYRAQVGSSLANVPSFLSVLLAIDESFPELLVFDAFEEQSEDLRRGLAPPPRVPSEAGRDVWDFAENGRTSAEGVQMSVNDQRHSPWNISDPEEAKLFPVRDRLADETVIAGRRRGHAEAILQRLGRAWQEVWLPSSQEEGSVSSFLAVSVYADAYEASRPWWERHHLRDDEVHHADLRVGDSAPRPTGDDMRALCNSLAEDSGEDLRRDDQHVFVLAPSSVAGWIGWYTRKRKGLKAIGFGLDKELQDFSPASPPDGREPGMLFFVNSSSILRTPEEHLDATSRDAAIILDVRSKPDLSPTLLPFRGEQGQPVKLAQAIKLVSEPGFLLETNEQVSFIIHDLLLVLGQLKQDYGIQRFHLAFACPEPLAILVGRELKEYSPVLLYEYEPRAEPGPAYDYVITLAE